MQLTGAGAVGAYASRGENPGGKEGSVEEEKQTMPRAIGDALVLLVTWEVKEVGAFVHGLAALHEENP